MNAVSGTQSIVKNTLYNNSNVQKIRPVTYLADMDVVGDYYPTTPKLATLKQDVFTPSKPLEETQKAHVSFMHKVARFFGLD